MLNFYWGVSIEEVCTFTEGIAWEYYVFVSATTLLFSLIRPSVGREQTDVDESIEKRNVASHRRRWLLLLLLLPDGLIRFHPKPRTIARTFGGVNGIGIQTMTVCENDIHSSIYSLRA